MPDLHDDPLAFVEQALQNVPADPDDALERDLAVLNAIAAGLRSATEEALEEFNALQDQMLPVAHRVGRCRKAGRLLKSYLLPALAAVRVSSLTNPPDPKD